MSIFDILKKTNIFPRVRNTDPNTSAQAADEAGKLSVQHGEIIVQALVAYGPMGKDQIAEVTYLDGNQVARRMKELDSRVSPTDRAHRKEQIRPSGTGVGGYNVRLTSP